MSVRSDVFGVAHLSLLFVVPNFSHFTAECCYSGAVERKAVSQSPAPCCASDFFLASVQALRTNRFRSLLSSDRTTRHDCASAVLCIPSTP
jgi:hypothetical protein